LKKVLIISPHFPPVNAADMHRVRQSVSYFKEFGWEAEVVMADEYEVEGQQDEDLLKTLPAGLVVHRVKAFSASWTRKIGLGNIALRSLWFYYRLVNRLLKNNTYDLIFFSTTMYAVCVLGRVWKRKFGVPYIIDVQDPWRSDHYLALPPQERPPKFWFSYRLDTRMEAYAMKKVDGLMAVSKGYIDTLLQRYPEIPSERCIVLPFGAYPKDIEVLENMNIANPFFRASPGHTHIAYVGRGGYDMQFACRALFKAVKTGLMIDPLRFGKMRFWFIGTSYDAGANPAKTIEPIAIEEGLGTQVQEFPLRVPYFTGLQILKDADLLIVPGSTDKNYTASKIYPYIMMRNPLLTVFHEQSSVNRLVQTTQAGMAVSFGDHEDVNKLAEKVLVGLLSLLDQGVKAMPLNEEAFTPYTAREMVRKEVELFDRVSAHE
jgi:hypothetical protein